MTEHSRKDKGKVSELKITFQPMGITCSVPKGQTIMAGAAVQSIALRSDCGGKGKCGKCAVEAAPSDNLSAVTDSEAQLLTVDFLRRGGRLACQARVEGGLTVSIAESGLDPGEARGKDLGGMTLSGRDSQRLMVSSGSGSLGLAIDIGTTTLALYLCDMHSGQILHTAAEANPQRHYGEDVISRIAHANDHQNGLEELRTTIVTAVNRLISQCLEETGLASEEIGKATVVGNTTMQHVFAGMHPGILGTAPYMPESCRAQVFRAADLRLALPEQCEVYLFPVISGFVGGDTVGAMLSDKPYFRDEITLLIDIGTNGEVVLGNQEKIWVTSCATGPALEGAHISCGMRASAGAIDKVSIDPGSYLVDYEIMGGDEAAFPRGLCGSGIVDTVAEMLRAGLILPSGRLCEGLPGVIADLGGIGREFVIADPPGRKPIVLTLADIRQVQLAKSALYTGITLLMKKAGINRFDRLVLTGAFGARFNWRNGVAIGMLPEISREAEVVLVENGAGQGAVLALLDETLREEARMASQNAQLLELAATPEFAKEFTAHTAFPESLE
ncbi:MAG: DUF4445 domain-containing protein [Desulfofustis sp.]|nr:DUF4445 domain-containing protein [Desulfofustis sp.]